ncbi:hypothetical protein COHA_010041 [Chlorella ohadii]|uniref:MYND-type domain-containing protein n=1 Tax=Chlorella ohadii TaxID=2649997 RepID=A0AAD5DDI3_9CHLO|nr:hypothetical protein COHA_010041 [Chlorella ohadii]
MSPERLKDYLSALGIPRKGAEQPRALANRLLDDAHHALLATPDAARRRGLAAPSAAAEAAALQALAEEAAGEAGTGYGNMVAIDIPFDGGDLRLVVGPTAFAVAGRVQMVLGRPLMPPESSSGTDAAPEAAGEAPTEAQQAQQAQDPDFQQGISEFLESVLQRAAALEGRQLSQLPAQARADLARQAGELLKQRLQSSSQTLAVPSRPGYYAVALQATGEDIEQLRASIRALRLPPAPGVLRCAACGAAADPPLLKLRCCAACRRIWGWLCYVVELCSLLLLSTCTVLCSSTSPGGISCAATSPATLSHKQLPTTQPPIPPRRVMYCSTDCQRSDWAQHKAACKAAQAKGAGAAK